MEHQPYYGMIDLGVAPEDLAAIAEEIAKTSSKIESVELALGGRGEYLGMGTTDKEKLLGQLDVLQTKEAQLQKKELLIMGAAVAGASAAAPTPSPPLPAAPAAPAFSSTRTAALPKGCLPVPAPGAAASPASSPASALSLSSAPSPSSAPAANEASGVGATTAGSHGGGGGAVSSQGGVGGQPSSPYGAVAEVGQGVVAFRDDPPIPGAPAVGVDTGVAEGGGVAQGGVAQGGVAQGGVAQGGVSQGVDTGVAEGGGVAQGGVAQGGVSQGGVSIGYGGETVAAAAGSVSVVAPATLPTFSHQPLAQTTGPAAVNIVGMVNSAPPTAPGGSGSALPGAVGVMDVNAPPTHAPLVGAPAIPGGSAATGYGAAAGVGAELLGQAYGTCVRSGQEDAARTRAGAVPVALPVTSMSTSFGGAPASAKGRAGAEGKASAGPPGGSKKRARPTCTTQCRHPGCTTARTFGRDGDKNASYCAVHKLEGMVNIKGRRCHLPGCQHRPGFAMPGEKRGKFCATHREPGMVDVVSRKCQVESGDCERQPVYGWPGERATRCGTHKLERTLTNLATGTAVVEKMYDVRGKRCQEKGCLRQPGFGHPVKDKGPVRCHEHKLEGQTNVRKRRALERQARQNNPDVDYPPVIHSQAEILHQQKQLKQEQQQHQQQQQQHQQHQQQQQQVGGQQQLGGQPVPPAFQPSYGSRQQPDEGAGGGGHGDSLPVPILPRRTAHAVASLGTPLAPAPLPVAGYAPFRQPPPDVNLPAPAAAVTASGAVFGEGQGAPGAEGVSHVLFMMQQQQQQQQQHPPTLQQQVSPPPQQQQQQQYNGLYDRTSVIQPGQQQQNGVQPEAPPPVAEPAAMAFGVPSTVGTSPATAV